MRILIFHGYLLGGTGSNVYNARLAEALVRLGHEVHLLCQERHPEDHRFLSGAGDWDEGELRVRELPGAGGKAAGPGRAVAYRPDIGGLLPVYVADRYEGMRGADVRGVHARGGGRVHRRERGGGRGGGRTRAARGRAREPPRDGAGDPRARTSGQRPLCGQGPRQRAGVHGEARTAALPGAGPRGDREGAGGTRRLAPHSVQPVGGDRGPGAPAAHAARAARCGRRALHAA